VGTFLTFEEAREVVREEEFSSWDQVCLRPFNS
jgi:hypothetical protein